MKAVYTWKQLMKGGPNVSLRYRNQQAVPTDHIMEQDTDKYFVPPEDQEDEHNTETISSTSTMDYD